MTMSTHYFSSMESLLERNEGDAEEHSITNVTSQGLSCPTQEQMRICLVGKTCEDKELIALIKEHFQLDVILSGNGTEFLTTNEQGHVTSHPTLVFVIDDFEGGDFNYLNGFTRIISPLFIRYCAINRRKLPCVRERRPLYCNSMKGMTFALDKCSSQECKRAVNLIHYMGGSARKEYKPNVILIGKIAGTSRYKVKTNWLTTAKCLSQQAVETGAKFADDTPKILTLEWIEACWKKRNDIYFSATDEVLMKQLRLKCFQGLRMYFLGFMEGELDEMKEKAKEQFGTIANNYNDASHVVCANEFLSRKYTWSEQASSFPIVTAHHVTIEWFWTSIQMEYCAREENFLVINGYEVRPLQAKENRKANGVSPALLEVRRACSKGSLDNSNNTTLPEHMFSGDDLDDVKKVDMRLERCKELLDTELNYIRMLELILSVYRVPLEESQPPLLSKQEIAVIFDKVPSLIPVHRSFAAELQKCIKNWDKESQLIGKIWAYGAADLEKVYPPYINSYDEATNTLEECARNSSKFHAFLELQKANPNCQRNSVRDMLIRPVQRIPSVLLLLQEIRKKTNKTNPDFEWLGFAIEKVQAVLAKTNEKRKQTEQYQIFLEICGDIEGFPPELYSSTREFLMSIDFNVLEVDGGALAKYKGKSVTFFLFNDVVVAARTRSSGSADLTTTFHGGTLTRKVSQISFAHKLKQKDRKKKYRYIEILCFNGFREFYFVRSLGVFFIKIRDASTEYLSGFQIASETTLDLACEFFEMLIQKIVSTSSRRDLSLEEVTKEQIQARTGVIPEDTKIMERALAAADQINRCGTIRRPSQLRRTLSNVSIGLTNISHGLQRMRSQAILPKINESFSSYH
jgi:hypothetical protein